MHRPRSESPREYIIRRWHEMPLEKRRTGNDAALFAVKMLNEGVRASSGSGDPYQHIMACLIEQLRIDRTVEAASVAGDGGSSS